MGLFGNYNKEGPGIPKNAPKKRTFFIFFETFFRNIWKFIPINLIYWVLTVFLIPCGLGAVGITNVARNTARDKHSFGVSDFLDTIKRNWKQALPAGIINVILYGILIFDVFFFYHGNGNLSAAGLGIIIAMMFILTSMNYYMWTLIITFKFTLKQIFKNSFKFVFLNIKANLLCFFSQLLVVALFVALPLFFGFSNKMFFMLLPIIFAVFVCLFPTFKFLLEQFCAFPAIKKHIIDPYYEEHPDEDIEKRRDLGLEIPEEESDEEDGEEGENVFTD